MKVKSEKGKVERECRRSAANDDTRSAANAAVPEASFEVLQPDGFFVPYGDYPHRNGLQRFSRKSAEDMQRAFSSLLTRALGAVENALNGGGLKFPGMPVYIGHPDVPGRGAEFPDKKAYGWVKNIEARDDGAQLEVKWSNEGRALIEGGAFAYYSPFWDMAPVAGGYSPCFLRSVGLTNSPNIPVPAMANDDASNPESSNPNQQTTMLDNIIKALREAGITKEGDSEDTILAAIGSLIQSLAWKREEESLRTAEAAKVRAALNVAENDAAEFPALLDQLIGAHAALAQAANDAAEAARQAAEVRTAARLSACNDALTAAIAAGRLTLAEAETQRADLIAMENDADFEAALVPLREPKPELKTKSVTTELGQPGKSVSAANDDHARGEARRALVDAKLKQLAPNGNATQEQIDRAWENARAEKPELF